MKKLLVVLMAGVGLMLGAVPVHADDTEPRYRLTAITQKDTMMVLVDELSMSTDALKVKKFWSAQIMKPERIYYKAQYEARCNSRLMVLTYIARFNENDEITASEEVYEKIAILPSSVNEDIFNLVCLGKARSNAPLISLDEAKQVFYAR